MVLNLSLLEVGRNLWIHSGNDVSTICRGYHIFGKIELGKSHVFRMPISTHV